MFTLDDWTRITDSDPRVADLARVAAEAASHRRPLWPADTYADVRPYLTTLVGWFRGRAPQRRNSPFTTWELRYVDVTARVPQPTTPADEEFLGSNRAYEVACAHLRHLIDDAVRRAAGRAA